jgi:CBS domain-containing protein
MKVQDVMTENVRACFPDTNLATAVALMLENDCGVLPVVVDGGSTVGVVTDRDIAIALGTRGQRAQDLRVDEVMTGELFACSPDDDIHTALKIMRRDKVRRLPVLADGGELKGILSINNVTLQAQKGNTELDYDDVVSTLKAICEHRHMRAAAAT